MSSNQTVRAAVSALALATVAALAPSCGGSSSPTDPTNPTVTDTITISAAGVSPKDIQITAGTRVRFVNNDNRTHNMSSDPHPEHTDCTEINQIGLLAPGQTRETGNLNAVRICRFHDHDLPNVSNLQGSITIR